jgi:tRNA(Phe) wybutosine-synthesizing methylase Tyw3
MFTLSSCSGRICLLNRSNFKKIENIWIFVSHDEVKYDIKNNFFEKLFDFDKRKSESENNLKKLEFRTEGPIIHICVNSFELASKLIEIGKKSGFNHAQIIGFRKKIVVELICDLNIICPIYENKLLINKDYLCFLIKNSNNILKEGWKRIENLKKEIFNL